VSGHTVLNGGSSPNYIIEFDVVRPTTLTLIPTTTIAADEVLTITCTDRLLPNGGSGVVVEGILSTSLDVNQRFYNGLSYRFVTSSPTLAPTFSPTNTPTQPLGSIIEFQYEGNDVSEFVSATSAVSVVSIRAGVTATGAEVIKVECNVQDDTVAKLVNAAPLIITAAGVQGRNDFEVIGVWDVEQLKQRSTLLECKVTSSDMDKMNAPIAIPLKVLGVAQPSLSMFCRNKSFTSHAQPIIDYTCGTSLTTNGAESIVIVGGTCDGCPQPPFHHSTIVEVGGVLADDIRVSSDGKQLEFQTPTIEMLEVQVNFLYNRYYPIKISTPPDSPQLGGSIILGPGDETPVAENGELACATRGLCPAGRRENTGVYYMSSCVGFPDASVDERWNSSTREVAALFAYGTAQGCRPCPLGCKCPGGDRCHTTIGYYLAEETLPQGSDSPAQCHANFMVAKLRCPGYSAALGRTTCMVGRDGSNCGSCAKGWFTDDTAGGECMMCPESGDTMKGVLSVVACFLVITTLSAHRS
jgi:hypothetical protein